MSTSCAVPREALEKAILDANEDLRGRTILGGGNIAYLRDVISIEKDVEGLSHRYCYSLYHNIRHIEGSEHGQYAFRRARPSRASRCSRASAQQPSASNLCSRRDHLQPL